MNTDPNRLGKVSSNRDFFVETLLSLGQTIDEGYSSWDWDYGEGDVPFEESDEQRAREGQEELLLQLLDANKPWPATIPRC